MRGPSQSYDVAGARVPPWPQYERRSIDELSLKVVDERERRRTLLGKLSGQTPRAFKLLQVAEGHWRCLDAAELVPLVRAGVRFEDGVQSESQKRKKAAA